jgi:hypothetical protein
MSLNFNDVENADQCPLYFATLAAFPDLTAAAALTRAFRTTPVYSSYAKGFIIDIGTIKDLISQNSGDVSGVKIYMGIEAQTKTYKAVAVATVGSKYEDFNIPDRPSEPCGAILGEGRPCPEWCGKPNALNEG